MSNKYAKVFEMGLIGGADLNLDEVGTLLENISLDYYDTSDTDLGRKNVLSKQYGELATHYNKILGSEVITVTLP